MSAAIKTAFLIMGPTASGKTALAIALAKKLNTEIVSADSRQCYKELSIGVARPSKEELDTISHHFIASHSIHEHIDAAVFEQYAMDKVTHIFNIHNQVVVCGGTGLYIHAFCHGIDDIPSIGASIRENVWNTWNNQGIIGLQNWIKEIDPYFWNHTQEKNNRVRLMRALEVKLTTGKSLLEFQKGSGSERSFHIQKIFIDWPRDILYERINLRVDKMMEDGLLDEAKSLVQFRSQKALQTVGYQELFDHLEGKISLDEAIALIKQHTRNYAKRQITWFKKEGWDIAVSGEALLQDEIPWSEFKI